MQWRKRRLRANILILDWKSVHRGQRKWMCFPETKLNSIYTLTVWVCSLSNRSICGPTQCVYFTCFSKCTSWYSCPTFAVKSTSMSGYLVFQIDADRLRTDTDLKFKLQEKKLLGKFLFQKLPLDVIELSPMGACIRKKCWKSGREVSRPRKSCFQRVWCCEPKLIECTHPRFWRNLDDTDYCKASEQK